MDEIKVPSASFFETWLFISFQTFIFSRVSVQGVKSLGGRLACLCRGFEFYEVKQNSTNLLLWPPICRNKSAITPKWFNLDTNSSLISSMYYLVKVSKCQNIYLAFFHVASLFSTGVDNKKVGVDNEKALELTNSTVFHRGRQLKSSRAGQQNNFFIF